MDSFDLAKRKGVPEDVLKQARMLLDTAQTYWEWWTAKNSDGSNNPQTARESITSSIDAS